MASALVPIFSRLGLLIQQPEPLSQTYSGTQYQYKSLVFRPALFAREAVLMVTLAALFATYIIGKKINEAKARSVWRAFDSKFSGQFKAMSPLSTQPLVTNSPSTYLHYLTGRRSLLSLHVIIELLPRYNVIQLIQDFVWGVVDPSSEIEDEVILDFTLGRGGKGQTGEGPGVWAVVRKSGILAKVKKERWDMSFTKQVAVPQIPESHTVLSESADSTDFFLGSNTDKTGLLAVLQSDAANVLKSLIITDQSSKRPRTGPLSEQHQARHLIITLSLSSNSTKANAEIGAWAQVGLNLVDQMGKTSVKPETTRKLRKTRQEVAAELTRAYEEELKEDRAEEEEDKLAAKRKEERKRREALPEAERKKLEEKEKRKQQKKAQLKQMKGGK